MRAAEADILIVPGLGDSGPEHWQSRWQNKLSTARRIAQRDWEAPTRADWAATIARAVLDGDRPSVIVAHSLGVVAALHAAQRIGDAIAGAFLVAPPSDAAMRDTPAIEAGFAPAPRARLPFPAIMVGSRDDPYADADFAPALAADLGATFIDAGAAGHLNVESGHGPWPEGLLAFAHFLARL